jgi:hypothetical protein
MKNVAAIAVISLAVAAGSSAHAQMTGVSHPDEVIVVNPGTGEQLSNYTTSPVIPPVASVAPPAAAVAPASPVLHPPSDHPVSYTYIPETRPALTPNGKPDIDADIVTRVPGPKDTLPQGTLLKIRLHEDLSTFISKPGDRFSGELTEDVERDGRVMLPAGSILTGRVTEVHGGRRISGQASIHLLPQTVTLPDGTRYDIHALVIDTSVYKATKVDREGTILSRDHPKETLALVGATAGTGAVAGGMLAGPPGAVVGATVGAGVSTTLWLKHERQTELPMNTRIVFSLVSPLYVGNGVGPIRESQE